MAQWERNEIFKDSVGSSAVPNIPLPFCVEPKMVFHVLEQGDYPSLSKREMLMSISFEEFIHMSLMSPPEFHQGRVCASHVDVLLSLQVATEG